MKKALALILSVGLVLGVAFVGGVKDTTKTTDFKAAQYDPPVGG